ncbi:MAG: hypothetical protein IKW79_06980 [Schwartzia sp.]|nr:hypothetical protein [Schwartzia sp. (in: firmicutes)]
MPRRQNKLAPEGLAAKAKNFLLNLAVAVGWLLRRLAGIFTGKKDK